MSQKKFEILLDIVAAFIVYLFISIMNWDFNIFSWSSYWYGIWAILFYLLKINYRSRMIYLYLLNKDKPSLYWILNKK